MILHCAHPGCYESVTSGYVVMTCTTCHAEISRTAIFYPSRCVHALVPTRSLVAGSVLLAMITLLLLSSFAFDQGWF